MSDYIPPLLAVAFFFGTPLLVTLWMMAECEQIPYKPEDSWQATEVERTD